MPDDTTTDATQGAIDHDFGEAERDAREHLADALAEYHRTEPMAGGVALDLVTRQPLFVRRRVADDLAEYYEAEGFDLLTYKMHPYLPVDVDDAVYECVFVPRSAEKAHSVGKTYDYPAGRLMHLPVETAWLEEDE